MTNILVELIDRKNNSTGNHTLHIETTFDNKNLQTFLNSLSSEQINYKFYYLNERFCSSFEELIKKFKLEIENKIIIEYEIDDLNHPTESLQVDGPIASLLYANENLYVSFYFSPVEVYRLKQTLERISTKKSACRILFGHENRLIGHNSSGEIVDVESENIVFDLKRKEISTLIYFNAKIYFGTVQGECSVYQNDIVEIYKGKTKVTGIYYIENNINFIFQSGEIISFNDESKEIKKNNLGFCPTTIYKFQDIFLYGSSESFIYEPLSKEKISVCLRYIKGIVKINTETILFYDQHNIVVFDFLNRKNINQLNFKDEITGVTIGQNNVFIGVRNVIFRYNINSLVH